MHDEKLGVMQVEGLSGPLCWAADMLLRDDEGSSVCIAATLVPPSPTEEEEDLVAAKKAAWQVAHDDARSD